MWLLAALVVAYRGIVLTMASNVWVLVPDEDRYIRGSEIIDVRVHISRGTSYGTEYEKGIVSITQARTTDEAGTSPRTLNLWTFATRPPAERAVQRLLAALSGDPQAVVYLDANNEVQASSLPTSTF